MEDTGQLLKTLEDLGEEDFTKFKWYLEQSSEIPKSQLEKADRLKTVDKIVETYSQRSLEVMEEILKKMKRNDLVEKLSNISLGEHVKPRTRRNSGDTPPTWQLLKTLEEEDFNKFKWHLESPEIAKSHLEKADRQETVDNIVQTHNQWSREVMEETLKKIKRNNLLQKLSNISLGEHVKLMTRSDSMETPSNLSCNTHCLSQQNTLTKETAANLTDMAIKHQDYLLANAVIDEGPPVRYRLPPKKKKRLRRWIFGKKDPNKQNKTILLVGETGSGKSTLINALCNYLMGIKFEDQKWFEVVEDEEEDTQSQSQTSEVTVYEIFGYEGKIVTYSLTIIDTPGYGHTRGIEHDAEITQKLHDLFCSDEGVHEINAVGLVLKAAENRLSDRVRYIFDSVMSLFEKDMKVKIVALITHSDGMPPKNALTALEDANIEFAKNEKNHPVHFMFNNCQSTLITEETEFGLKHAWAVTTRGMDQFADFLEKTAPQKLEKTVEVLKERIRLAACINNLTERIEFIEQKQKQIQQTQEGLEKLKEAIRRGQNVTIEVDEPYKEKESIDGGVGFLLSYSGAVCCTICKENCHYPGCTWTWSPRLCQVMKGGRCTVCTGRCPASKHVKEKKKYVIKIKKVTKTVAELKQNLDEVRQKDQAEEDQNDILLSNLQREKEKLEEEINTLLDEAYQRVVKLEQIALNVNSMFTYVHLDLLIEKMEEKGNAEKVKKLKMMKSRVDKGILAAVRYRLGCVGGKVTALPQVAGKAVGKITGPK